MNSCLCVNQCLSSFLVKSPQTLNRLRLSSNRGIGMAFLVFRFAMQMECNMLITKKTDNSNRPGSVLYENRKPYEITLQHYVVYKKKIESASVSLV